MINGAFGVGKTTTTQMLVEKVENSMIFDPEEVGYMLRNIITDEIKHEEEKKDDFQALELWRVLTVKVAEELKRKYQKNLILPMTIRNYDYFRYIFDGLKKIDNDVHHFCLTAKKETIYNRLIQRGDKEGSWALQQIDECIENYSKYDFSHYINTDEVEVSKIVNIILEKIIE